MVEKLRCHLLGCPHVPELVINTAGCQETPGTPYEGERQAVLSDGIRYKTVGWSWNFLYGGAEIMTRIADKN